MSKCDSFLQFPHNLPLFRPVCRPDRANRDQGQVRPHIRVPVVQNASNQSQHGLADTHQGRRRIDAVAARCVPHCGSEAAAKTEAPCPLRTAAEWFPAFTAASRPTRQQPRTPPWLFSPPPFTPPLPHRRPARPPPGPEWDVWRAVLVGRELRRTVEGQEQVGVLLFSVGATASRGRPLLERVTSSPLQTEGQLSGGSKAEGRQEAGALAAYDRARLRLPLRHRSSLRRRCRRRRPPSTTDTR
jgi:hypothetical protein